MGGVGSTDFIMAPIVWSSPLSSSLPSPSSSLPPIISSITLLVSPSHHLLHHPPRFSLPSSLPSPARHSLPSPLFTVSCIISPSCPFMTRLPSLPLESPPDVPAIHPTHPTHPAHPTHPTHPAHPTHPTHPAHPTHSTHPTHPIHPIHPTHPIHPIHPIHPTHPIHPIHPIHPTHPIHPIHSIPTFFLQTIMSFFSEKTLFELKRRMDSVYMYMVVPSMTQLEISMELVRARMFTGLLCI